MDFAKARQRAALRANAWNISTRRIGGVRWFKFGRFTFTFCIATEYRSL